MSAPPLIDVKIMRQDYRSQGSYVATVAGVHGIARLLCKRPHLSRIVADRTELSDALKGRGIGHASLARIQALCPFVNAEQLRHPERADAFLP